MAMTIVEGTRPITGGVDTHLDVHVAAALDDSCGLPSKCRSRAGNSRERGPHEDISVLGV